MENKKTDQYTVAFSVFWLTSSIFTTLALYDFMLRPYVSTLENGLMPHTVGPTGFELAQLLVLLFGYGAFVMPVFLLLFCTVPFFDKPLDRLRMFNALLIYLLIVAMLNLTLPIHMQDPFFTAGGIIGKKINDYIYLYVDFTGSYLLIGAMLLVCLEYQFHTFWQKLFVCAYGMIVSVLASLGKFLCILWQQTFTATKPTETPISTATPDFPTKRTDPLTSRKTSIRTGIHLEKSPVASTQASMVSPKHGSRQSPILPTMGSLKSAVSARSSAVTTDKPLVTTGSISANSPSQTLSQHIQQDSSNDRKVVSTDRSTNLTKPAAVKKAVIAASTDAPTNAMTSTHAIKASTKTAHAVLPVDQQAEASTQSAEKNYESSPPPLDLLNQDKLTERIKEDPQKLQLLAQAIEDKLKDFGVKAKVMNILLGPIITRFEIQPAPGTKASKITGLSRDLARSLSVTSVRVVEVIAGKTYIGLEIPNKNRVTVSLKTLFESHAFQVSKSALCLALGVDISGDPVVVDLAKMPHMLVAGTTGSGKSVGLNTMLLSLLYKTSPEDLKLILIDPKMLEFAVYEGIPHLLTSVVTDMNDASFALSWCVNEMERRYKLMAELGVRNISSYNAKVKQVPDIETTQSHLNTGEPEYHKHLPYIVVIADEFADMMMMVGKKVETLIARLAQKARAAGIHLILATQRPSVDVITGLIKANIPTRISFQVSSKIDSRTILDQQGAESLLGAGDMLYLSPGSGLPIRCHGAFVSDEAIAGVVKHLRSLGKPSYIELNKPESSDSPQIDMLISDDKKNKDDALYDQIIDFVTTSRKVSTSSVQRRFRIGYNRAAVMVDRLEQEGVISPMDTNGQRQVLAPPPSKYDD